MWFLSQQDSYVCTQVRQQDRGRAARILSHLWLRSHSSSSYFFFNPVSCVFLSSCFVHSLSFCQYFSLSLYHRPLTPATAAVVGRLSSQGRLKIERDRTREAEGDFAPFNGKEIASWNGCVFYRLFSKLESRLPLFEQWYQRLHLSRRSDPHPVERCFHLSSHTCGLWLCRCGNNR